MTERKLSLVHISEGKIQKGPLRLKINNKKITLVHDINKINPKKEKANLVICGHTHKSEILRQGTLVIVNPGECGGWLTTKSTVALIDLDSLSSQIFKL